MHRVSKEFFDELQQQVRFTVELVEFFQPEEEDFSPHKAAFRYGNVKATWMGLSYDGRMNARGDIRRHLGKQVNTMSLVFNNVDLHFSGLMKKIRFEGMWVQIRIISQNSKDESLVIFAGRADKPSRSNARTFEITIRQGITGGDDQIPKRRLDVLCPLASDFKGFECRGGIPLESKPLAYRNAIECAGTEKACVERQNRQNFQGITARTISGNLTYEEVTVQRFLLFFKKKKKKVVSVPWSSVNDSNDDAVIPEVGGVTQVLTTPAIHADTGAGIKFLNFVMDGEHSGISQLIVRDKKYLPNVSGLVISQGLLGDQGQTTDNIFGSGPFSGVTWLNGEILGSDPTDANDQTPTITAIVHGRKYDLPDDTGRFTQRGWADCGPYMVRWYLKTFGRIPQTLIDDRSFLDAAFTTFEPVIDDTGAEQRVVPQHVTANVDFRAWASASGFRQDIIDTVVHNMARGKAKTGSWNGVYEGFVRYINQLAPPPFIEPLRKVRRRYTTNFVLTEQTSVLDFIYDMLLESFNGQIIFSADGKLKLRVEKAADFTLLIEDAAAGATTVVVEDITRWRIDDEGLLLVGAHHEHSEMCSVWYTEFMALVDPIDLLVTTSGGITHSNPATLSGGAASVPDAAEITFGGSISVGAVINIAIDGVVFSYTTAAGNILTATVAFMAAMINGHDRMRRYIKAIWREEDPLKIRLETKVGKIVLFDPLASAHIAGEETIRVLAAFGGETKHDWKIFEEPAFDWPLGSRQTSTNRIESFYFSAINDWARTTISVESGAHVKQTRKRVKEEINLSAVDNAHQAARLCKIALGKRRLCDWFCEFMTAGPALLLDVGDIIAVTHYSGAGMIQNVPVVIEEIVVDRMQRVRLTCRLYRTEVYDDTINERSPEVLFPLKPGAGTNPDPGTLNPPNLVFPGRFGLVPRRPAYDRGFGGYGTGGARPFYTIDQQ